MFIINYNYIKLLKSNDESSEIVQIPHLKLIKKYPNKLQWKTSTNKHLKVIGKMYKTKWEKQTCGTAADSQDKYHIRVWSARPCGCYGNMSHTWVGWVNTVVPGLDFCYFCNRKANTIYTRHGCQGSLNTCILIRVLSANNSIPSYNKHIQIQSMQASDVNPIME